MNDNYVSDIISSSVQNYPTDMKKALEESLERIKRLPNYRSLVEDLIKGHVQTMIYEARHRQNVRIRRETGQYGQPSKVKVGESKEVRDSYMSCYLYFIGGMTLGQMTGDDLVEIALGEKMKAEGHMYNVKLLEAIQPFVKSDQRVQDAIPEKKLKGIFSRVRKEVDEAAA